MSTKMLTPLNMAQNALLNAVMHPLAAAPSSPVAGQVYFDTTLHEFGVWTGSAWVYLGSGGGTVTSVSVTSANGLAGTVASPSATPALTLSVSVTGLLKGNGTAISAAVSGTDYAPATSGTALLKGSGSGGFSAATAGTDYLAPAGNGSALTGLAVSQVTGAAPLASPALTGTPTAPTPSTSTGIANKGYVDSAVQGISAKYTAAAATTGAETYTITAGSVTQITGTAVDGVSPNVNDYVLVMSAPAASGTGTANVSGTGTSQPANGLYQVTGNTTNLSLSRAADMSGANSPFGSYVFVAAGTANGSNGYAAGTPSTSAAFTYGTGNIQFVQFSGAGDPVAGAGLARSGNTLSVENSGVLTVAHGGTGGATAAAAKTSLGFGSVYTSGAIGDGTSTTLTVTHSLGNAVPLVQVYDVTGASPVQVICDVTATSASAVQLGFGAAPASGGIKCVVVG